ncbi:ASKHA domain-containing protein [bacterium]|nr:ASKHA domain-containing protein [bacterium]
MHTVKFLPSNKEITVPTETLISDAAIKAGIGDLHLPCGGKGTCGRCLVELVEGHVEQDKASKIDSELAKKNLVMACRSHITGDITVRITPAHDISMRVVGDSHLLIGEDHLPDMTSLTPLVRSVELTIPPASIDENYSDWQRMVRELSKHTGSQPITSDVHVLQSLASAVREQDGNVTVLFHSNKSGVRVTEVLPGHDTNKLYGVAIDIGTTTAALQLVDLVGGRVVSSRTSYNAQIRLGSDIISRIDYARTPQKLSELHSLVIETINGLIADAATDSDLHADDIKAAFISGNMTMIHLFLALPPKYIRESPYVTTVNAVPCLSADQVGLNIAKNSPVEFAPGVGSYVGGDITAGLLCTDIPTNSDEVFLFLDIGTNGEIVLGNADWVVSCACSAGPAFEGSGIKCGMRASEGAIEYVKISDDLGRIDCDVIGGVKPSGICGSGLICLLGELFIHGIIDQMGHFNTDLATDRLDCIDGKPVFIIERAENTANSQDLIITEVDIENLMRTKAAIYAACSLILDNVGLDYASISRVYIAGGFGRYIHIEDAVLIGMLPDLPYERFTYIGNSSLTGSYIALLSQDHRDRLTEIASKMTYIDLSSDNHYMDAYLSALFLPHTDIGRFPSVAKLIGH